MEIVWNENILPFYGESYTSVNIGVVSKLVVLDFFGTKYIKIFLKLINPDKREMVPHHSAPVAILMIHVAGCEPEKNKSHTGEYVEEDLALLLMPTPHKQTY